MKRKNMLIVLVLVGLVLMSLMVFGVARSALSRNEQIDKVWDIINGKVGLSGDPESKIWHSGEWKGFDEGYQPAVPAKTTGIDVASATQKIISATWPIGYGWDETEFIEDIIRKSIEEEINPCYAVVIVLHESRGKPNAVGNDANVVGCLVHARRLLLMKESMNCQSRYADEQALLTGCLEETVISGRWAVPTRRNACLNDFLNTGLFNAPKPTKEEICGETGNFKPYLRYGIGLGQMTPFPNQYYKTVAGKSYSYCELFDPSTNIKATVDKLKGDLAGGSPYANNEVGRNPEEVKKVLAGYIGIKTLPQGELRYKDFKVCERLLYG